MPGSQDGEKLSGRYLERVTKTGGRQHLEKKLRAALDSSDPAELDAVLKVGCRLGGRRQQGVILTRPQKGEREDQVTVEHDKWS